MKSKIISLFTAVAVLLTSAGYPLLTAQTSPPAPADSSPLLSQADLEQLVAPIALYPDPMIALILPASTVPTDVVLADRYVQDGKDANAIDQQNWDESVKGLARYPDVLKMMDDNLDWTNQLGAAVLAQQPDVMTAIQSQRAKAQSLGNLQTTPQQKVIVEKQVIQIVPADPQVIYVPTYDPQVVYVDQSPAVPFISFGLGFAVGAWIGGGCDWYNHGIYSSGYYRPGWGYNNNVNININNNYNHNNVWRPNPNKPRPRPPYNPNRPGNGGGKPGQLPGWHRPPNNGNKPGRPGGPGGPGNNLRPPGSGGNNGGGNNNRPGNGSGNNNNKPGFGHGPGSVKPGTKPATLPGTTRPAYNPKSEGNNQHHSPNNRLPNNDLPRPNNWPNSKPNETRPINKPAQQQHKPSFNKPAQQQSRPAFNKPAQQQSRPANHPQKLSGSQRPAGNNHSAPQRGKPAENKGQKK